ncbi:peptidase M61 [Zeaxanthinibacter sp. PT1]|uniref:M61 family metallopeptidase n=1 Tax=Zeaxanthinibacter TaxID=561554 RepID=UPI00234AACD2|nr:peptidase M61 [Zeaxanthinibacter sp. PT1]MDC6350206.1 peptidase M61 [Zeaxanthinibacter sp. PT1]
MKRLSIYYLLLSCLIISGCGASKSLSSASSSPIVATLDLVNIENDKVSVTVDPGAFSADNVTFYIPKTVPGTYSVDDYGQYVEALKAIDYKGNEMPVIQADENSWKISGAKDLDKVVYWVNDTYDTESETENAVFSPAGTNIDKGNTYMLNLHGFVGYFDGFKEVPYQVDITVSSGLVATTSLKRKNTESTGGQDTFLAARYFEVIDNPIMYAKPNNISFQVQGITVNLAVYSPNGTYDAVSLEERMKEMMGAQKAFLGPIDGTEEYNILLHLSPMGPTDPSGFGALEHHTSTVVVLPEQMPKENLEQAMVDVVSHEFFHIVTPLNVHSEEIQFFDFNAPVMSKHLWMYEGTTEYFANLFQINQGLIQEEEFYQRLVDKIGNSRSYDDAMSFTVMSENILESPYKENYANVYEKGALINMSLDILLRELSGGEKGVLWLMKTLSDNYGNNTPFKDDTLIEEIVEMTYPEIGEFFNTYVIGDTPINYEEFLSKVGLSLVTVQEESGYFLQGQIPYIDVDQKNDDAIFVRKGITLNSFMNNLGLQGGDVIEEINGTPVSLESIRPIIGESFGWNADKEISMTITRDGEQIELKGLAGTPMVKSEKIVAAEDASAEELALREAWMKN